MSFSTAATALISPPYTSSRAPSKALVRSELSSSNWRRAAAALRKRDRVRNFSRKTFFCSKAASSLSVSFSLSNSSECDFCKISFSWMILFWYSCSNFLYWASCSSNCPSWAWSAPFFWYCAFWSALILREETRSSREDSELAETISSIFAMAFYMEE